jgi:hypothetical protein
VSGLRDTDGRMSIRLGATSEKTNTFPASNKSHSPPPPCVKRVSERQIVFHVVVPMTRRYQLVDPSPEMAHLPEFQDFLKLTTRALQVGPWAALESRRVTWCCIHGRGPLLEAGGLIWCCIDGLVYPLYRIIEPLSRQDRVLTRSCIHEAHQLPGCCSADHPPFHISKQVDELVRRAWEEERIPIKGRGRPSVFLAQLQQWYPGYASASHTDVMMMDGVKECQMR